MRVLQSFVSMLCFLWGAAMLLHLQPISAAAVENSPNAADFIRTSCANTSYPNVCYKSLSHYADAVQGDWAKLVRFAITVSLPEVRRMATYISRVSRQAHHGRDRRTATAIAECVMDYTTTVHYVRGSIKQMRRLRADKPICDQIGNVQSWMAGVETDWDTCSDAMKDARDGRLKNDVSRRGLKMYMLVNNALLLLYNFAIQNHCVV